MLRQLRITTVIFAIALLVAALASSAAIATTRVEIGSRVTLAQSDPFHGKVLSKRAICQRNRTVEVYNAAQGGGLYDSTRSNSEGEWAIPTGTPNGDYYAVAKRRSIDAGSKILVCRRAISPTVAF